MKQQSLCLRVSMDAIYMFRLRTPKMLLGYFHRASQLAQTDYKNLKTDISLRINELLHLQKCSL